VAHDRLPRLPKPRFCGDYVVARWEGTYTGTAILDMPHGWPIPAVSGREAFLSGMSILKSEDGRVTEDIGQKGALDGHLQLGAVVANAPAS
jgi:hypothetical protein